MAEDGESDTGDSKSVIENFDKKQLGIGVVAVAVVALVGGMLLTTQGEPNPQNYVNASSDTVHNTDKEAAKTYEISDLGVSPASHTVQLGKSVGFENQLDSTVEISFDRSNDTIQVQPDEEETLYMNGITYFTVEGVETDYEAQGRVNIQ